MSENNTFSFAAGSYKPSYKQPPKYFVKQIQGEGYLVKISGQERYWVDENMKFYQAKDHSQEVVVSQKLSEDIIDIIKAFKDQDKLFKAVPQKALPTAINSRYLTV